MRNLYLHLESLSDMLPCMAASGHSLYAKSARLYLQFMLNNVVSEFHVVEVIAPGLACQ